MDYILKLQSTVNEEIREGLSNLFHQAKSCTEEAQKNISKYQKMTENAQKKLTTKKLDLIIANQPENFGSEKATIHLLHPDGKIESLKALSKEEIAYQVLNNLT